MINDNIDYLLQGKMLMARLSTLIKAQEQIDWS